jgi:ATP-binding cassette subfamily B protein
VKEELKYLAEKTTPFNCVLLRKPRLLLFDEATSALDSITEEEITKTIRSISSKKNQITVLIAHRLSTIMHADKIFVLEQGKLLNKENMLIY